MRYLVPCMMIGIIHTRDDEGGHDGHASPPFAVTAMLHYFYVVWGFAFLVRG